ncbi:MAG: hypothetical protein Q7R40_01675 [Phaeospirillum sp.]|nr:hypothetical protein [Phaeospirillum sp.]
MAAVFLALALAACAEITKFQNSDGTAYYYVNCESSLRVLETCSFAARRTCPNGYSPAKASAPDISADDRQYSRCIEQKKEREENGETPIQCVPKKYNEGYFTCK